MLSIIRAARCEAALLERATPAWAAAAAAWAAPSLAAGDSSTRCSWSQTSAQWQRAHSSSSSSSSTGTGPATSDTAAAADAGAAASAFAAADAPAGGGAPAGFAAAQLHDHAHAQGHSPDHRHQKSQQEHAAAAHTTAGREAGASWAAAAGGGASSRTDSYAHAYPYAAYEDELEEEEDEEQRRQRHSADHAQFEAQRDALLSAALRHVPRLGWGGGAAAAATGAADLGLSPAAAGMLGGSDAQLVQLFFARCNRQLEAELAGGMAGELAAMDVKGRLRRGVEVRLRMLEPYMANWAQALSLLAQPSAAPRTLQLYAELADAIWHAAGDTSTDFKWYTKRALLTAAYTATELYMVTDCSPDFADTWAALDRRLDEMLGMEAAAGDVGALAGAVSGAAGAALSTLGGLLRRPGQA